MAIFQGEPKTIGISDQMTLNGWEFDAQMVISEKNGDAAAIHGGRILVFQLTCDGEIIAYFDNGDWYQLPDINFEEGCMARELLVEKWSKTRAFDICPEEKTEEDDNGDQT